MDRQNRAPYLCPQHSGAIASSYQRLEVLASSNRATKSPGPNRIDSSSYERMQENARIIRRIMNPKRDKTILKSMESVRSRSGQLSQARAKTHHQSRSLHHSENLANRNLQQHSLKLQNQKMGLRIINSRPMVGNHLPIFSCNQSRSSHHPKINQGVRAFFHNQKVATGQTMPLCHLKPVYGYGPTILSLSSISFRLNPHLKEHDLVCLQLLVPSSSQKLYRTNLIPYSVLTKSNIKFAIRLKKIGEFVPLKVWKVQGVQSFPLGIVDINFLPYLEKESQQELIENGEEKPRFLIKDRMEANFRRQKRDELQGSICFDYAIYRKRYV